MFSEPLFWVKAFSIGISIFYLGIGALLATEGSPGVGIFFGSIGLLGLMYYTYQGIKLLRDMSREKGK